MIRGRNFGLLTNKGVPVLSHSRKKAALIHSYTAFTASLS